MSQQMKDLAEDGDTKLNQVLEQLDEIDYEVIFKMAQTI